MIDNFNLQIFIARVFHGVSVDTLHVPQRTSLHPELFPALFYLPNARPNYQLLNVTNADTTTNNNSPKTRKLSTES